MHHRYDAIPEPKHPGDPDWLVAKVQALEKPDHGMGGVVPFSGDSLPGLFPVPDQCKLCIPKA